MYQKLASLALWCFFCVNSSIVFSGVSKTDHPLVLSNVFEKYELGNHVILYEDTSGKLDFNKVRNLYGSFRENQSKTINLGTTSSALWCMFTVRNESQKEWFIRIGEPYVDIIDLYSINREGEIKLTETGFLRGTKHRQIKVNQFILPLDLGFNEEKTYYIRARSNSFLKMPLVIGTIQSHYETSHKKDVANGIYLGLIIALSLYNLFVFISLRDKTYLYYVFYINSLGATISWIRGYSPEFLNDLPVYFNQGNIFSSLAFIFLVLFTESFLNLGKTAPAHKWVKAGFFTFSLVSIFVTLLGHYYLGFLIIMILIPLNFPYIATFGIYALLKGFRPALFYLLGFTFFTIGDIIFILNENAKIEQNLLSEYSLQIGSALESIILSFALANKLNLFKKENEKTQAKALAQANEFSKELIRTQEYERKRIAGELHDSVGQSLSLIKNHITLLKKKEEKTKSLDELNDVVTNTIQEVRNISYGLRPFQLDIIGLTQSIKSLIEDVSESSEVIFSADIDNIDGIIPKDAEINIFRIVQECINNISKHSGAVSAKITIRNRTGKIGILVEDDGIGIEKNNKNGGFGLIGIKERVNILRGKLEISNGLSAGTKVNITI